MLLFEKYKNFVFDLDGTLYLGETLFEGVVETLNFLIENSKNLIFISNKTTGNYYDYANILINAGVKIKPEQVVNATLVISQYLKENYSGAKFYCIGEDKFIKSLEDIGLKYTEDIFETQIVIVTLDRFLTDSKIDIAKKALENGAKFFAANTDKTCPVENKKQIIDAGIVIEKLENLTGRKLELSFGKPTQFMINYIKNKFDNNLPGILCGDRLETDIVMGQKLGFDTAWVKTGIDYNDDVIAFYKPTYILDSVSDLAKKIVND